MKIDWTYEFNKRLEKLQIKVSHLMPKWLVKWCAIRLMVHATQGKWSKQIVPDLTAMDALKRWSEK